MDESEMATRLAARLCHDFVGPAGGVVSGLDLLKDAPSPEIREAAQELIDTGARRLLDLIVFARTAYGGGDRDADTALLETLARSLFADQRPTLEWAVDNGALPGVAARALLILAQIAGEALAAGGRARAWARANSGGTALGVEATGPRARLHADLAAGLSGAPPGEGPSGRWIQGAFLRSLVKKGGGTVAVEARDGAIEFNIQLP